MVLIITINGEKYMVWMRYGVQHVGLQLRLMARTG